MEYPEHEKLKAVKDKSQIIGEFLEWLDAEGIRLARYEDDGDDLICINESIEKILARRFNIDLAKIENERQHMLETLRNTDS